MNKPSNVNGLTHENFSSYYFIPVDIDLSVSQESNSPNRFHIYPGNMKGKKNYHCNHFTCISSSINPYYCDFVYVDL